MEIGHITFSQEPREPLKFTLKPETSVAVSKLTKTMKELEGKNKMEKLDNDKFYYYYFRDDNNNPLITVCLLKGKEGIAKGIAVCSPDDNPEKVEGKSIAKKRALKAYLGKRIGEHIRSDNAAETLACCGSLLDKMWNLPKVWFNPELSSYEKRILRKSDAKC